MSGVTEPGVVFGLVFGDCFEVVFSFAVEVHPGVGNAVQLLQDRYSLVPLGGVLPPLAADAAVRSPILSRMSVWTTRNTFA